jgi:high-affinity K+ transport system ATPase subunit B
MGVLMKVRITAKNGQQFTDKAIKLTENNKEYIVHTKLSMFTYSKDYFSIEERDE